eukprot:Skav224048  [mRNA]  locus=scaffold534:34197:38273:+ [translate_table: standard]
MTHIFVEGWHLIVKGRGLFHDSTQQFVQEMGGEPCPQAASHPTIFTDFNLCSCFTYVGNVDVRVPFHHGDQGFVAARLRSNVAASGHQYHHRHQDDLPASLCHTQVVRSQRKKQPR